MPENASSRRRFANYEINRSLGSTSIKPRQVVPACNWRLEWAGGPGLAAVARPGANETILHATCEALDGCSQPEGFDSPVLHATVQPNWNWKAESGSPGVLTRGAIRHSLKVLRRRAQSSGTDTTKTPLLTQIERRRTNWHLPSPGRLSGLLYFMSDVPMSRNNGETWGTRS